MHSICPHCGARNHVLRVFTWISGVHVRCRGCRRVVRVLDSIGGLVMLGLAFSAGYIAGFVALFDLWLGPDLLGDSVTAATAERASWLLALLPLLPAGLLSLLTLGLLADRRGPEVAADESEASPSRGMYGFTYVLLSIAAVALIGVSLFGFLMVRFAEPMPPADPSVRLEEPLQVPAEDAEEFAFIDTEGNPHTLLEMRGQPVVLQVFVPGSRQVSAGLHSLARLRREVFEDGARVVACALVEPAAFRAFCDATSVRMPFVRRLGELPAIFTPGGLPTTWVFDAEGRLVLEQAGVRRWDVEPMIELISALARK